MGKLAFYLPCVKVYFKANNIFSDSLPEGRRGWFINILATYKRSADLCNQTAPKTATEGTEATVQQGPALLLS